MNHITWLKTIAFEPGLDCRMRTSSRVKASIFEEVANSAKLIRRRIEPVATCFNSFSDGKPEWELPVLAAEVMHNEESSSMSTCAWRSMEKASLHEGHVKFEDAAAKLFEVAMYSRTQERQKATPESRGAIKTIS